MKHDARLDAMLNVTLGILQKSVEKVPDRAERVTYTIGAIEYLLGDMVESSQFTRAQKKQIEDIKAAWQVATIRMRQQESEA